MSAPDHRFLRACRREAVDCTPVWFMRQAGRYQASYRKIREKHSMLEICSTPDLATQVTMLPVNELPVDAAILFADLLPPLVPMGIQLEYRAGDGPVIGNPVRSHADVKALRPVDVEESLGSTLQAVRQIVAELGGRLPLIGFAGAPFTLASYLIEGGSSRHHVRTKRFMYEEPEAWHDLMMRLAVLSAQYLRAQVEAGAAAAQLFDSWVGHLSPADYREFVLPHSRTVLTAVEATEVPVIHFGVDTGGMLHLLREAGGTVIGVDWRTDLDQARDTLGPGVALQGNLDPVCLFAPRDVLRDAVRRVVASAGQVPGHIFNLGHGILPDTPEDNVRFVADLVHELTATREEAP